jgi:Fe-S oxidoreductase
MGEQILFKKLVTDNTALFRKSGVKRIITISPHCFNAFEYGYPGLNIPVQHYTQILTDLIEAGNFIFQRSWGYPPPSMTPVFWETE